MKTIAIMQPYFLPYIGYFQLMSVVDEFVIYDNIQFSKRGWIHRNRIIENGKDVYITLPIKKDSDYLDIDKRFLADNIEAQRKKLIAKIENNYRKAPYFNETIVLCHEIFNCKAKNLFDYIYNSLIVLMRHLEINTLITKSSSIEIDHTLKSSEKVKAIVNKLKGEIYINPIGGVELYDKKDFNKNGIDLRFIKTNTIVYHQSNNKFIEFLSIVDVLMYNDKEKVKKMLNEYTFN